MKSNKVYYFNSLLCVLLMFLPVNMYAANIRSVITIFRVIIYPRKTKIISDGLGTIIAYSNFYSSGSLYLSKKELNVFKYYFSLLLKNLPPLITPEQKVWPRSETSFFIGQGLSENGLVDIEHEISTILKYKFCHYIPHPKDSKQKLDYLISENISILSIEKTAEEYLYEHGFKWIYGFSSSVLWNTRNSKRVTKIKIKYKSNWLGEDCLRAYELI